MIGKEVMTFDEVAARMSTADCAVSRQSVYMWTRRGVKVKSIGKNGKKTTRTVKLQTIRYPAGKRVTHELLTNFIRQIQGDTAAQPAPVSDFETDNPLNELVD